MSQQNVETIRAGYAALNRGDLEAVLKNFDEDIVFNLAENSPYHREEPYRGKQDLVQNLLTPLATEVENFTIVPEAIHDAGDVVVVQGRYKGRNVNTGLEMNLQLCHVYQFRNGLVTRLDQYTDTLGSREVYGAHGRYATAK